MAVKIGQVMLMDTQGRAIGLLIRTTAGNHWKANAIPIGPGCDIHYLGEFRTRAQGREGSAGLARGAGEITGGP